MKKLTKIWSLVLAMLLLTACCGTPVVIAPPADKAPEEEVVQPQPEAGTAVKTGLAVVPGVGSSKDATAEENGVAQSDITLVAVTVDDNGVITDCVIDGIQAKIAFGADGKLVTDPATTFPTKNELGASYGMGQFSPIGKEWNEQMAALAQYAVGKTVDELKGIALNEKGAATDADLAASCTISIGGTVDAIVQAVENATHLGAVQGDELSIGASTNMSKSKDAADGEDGVAQAYATIAAVTFRSGVISSCAIDAVQANVNFDAAGKITTDLSAPVLTKNQLGDDYGMKKASSIGKEWYEQAAAFAQYATGKTLDEINGIALNEKGGAADADLAASVTVSLGGFQEIIAKAAPSKAVKTGLAVVPSVAKSADAAEENGVAQSDIDLVAVLVDDNGVITDCAIDSIQAKIAFGADGKLVTDPATTFATKNELGKDYGMGQFSPIGKEWNEQVEALAQYAIGKTVDELKGISLGERAEATDADLAASCTISIAGYLNAIAQAVENAQHLGAAQGDELSIGTSTNMSKSKDAADGADGVAQAYATIAAVTFRSGVISSCAIDAVQANVNFDAAGKITTDLSAPVLTKNQLGDDYGMKKASSIGKEWYEQAAAFAQYATGKTIAEINGIALNEKGGAADADLAASVTVSLGGFQEIIAKAAA